MTEMADLLRRNQIDPASLDVLAEVDDHRIWQLTAPGGKRAVEIWQQIRLVAEPIGHWPVLLGEPFELSNLKEALEDSAEGAADILSAAAELDGEKVLEERDQSWREELAEFNEGEPEDFLPKVGAWPENAKPSTAFTIPYNILNSDTKGARARGNRAGADGPTMGSIRIFEIRRLERMPGAGGARRHRATMESTLWFGSGRRDARRH